MTTAAASTPMSSVKPTTGMKSGITSMGEMK